MAEIKASTGRIKGEHRRTPLTMPPVSSVSAAAAAAPHLLAWSPLLIHPWGPLLSASWYNPAALRTALGHAGLV